MDLTAWAVILGLILVNALYVAAEFAAVSVSTSRIQQQAEQGSPLARRLLPFLRDAHALDRYIAACQIGITVSSLVLGAYGQATLAEALTPHFARLGDMQAVTAQGTAAVVVLVVLTAFQMVLGELVPKSLALQYPTRLALWTVMPMQGSLWLFSWFIKVLNGSGTLILRLIGFEQSGQRHIHSPEELELLIAESREGGLLKPEEHRRLRGALRLGQVTVAELMVPRTRIQALDIDTPADETLAAVTASPYTRLPVFRGGFDEIIGFVHAKNVARLVAANTGALSLRALVQPILAVPRHMTAERLLARMREERQQFAVVLDEFGGTAGLVSIEDVLEELVGDVVDELKSAEPGPERLPDGRVRLPGELRIAELEPWVGTTWTEGKTYTVGGRVVDAFGRIPLPGERTVIEGVAVEVERLRRRAVASVLATPLRPPG